MRNPPLRIGLLTASASRLGGGVFEAVALQAQLIAEHGDLPVVIALEDAHAQEDRHRFGATDVITAPVKGPRQVGYAPDLTKQLLKLDLDLLHLHGIWMYPSRAGASWARRTGRPYLISPHGMLDPWITARGRWKKTLARAGYERTSWRAATGFHALTEREAGDIARESGRRNSIVIPNPGPKATEAGTGARSPQIGYIGRIHPKKNVIALVDAWSSLADSGRLPDDASLVIAGWGDEADVANLRSRMEAAPTSARFIGSAYGEEKRALLSKSRFLALPSFSEGLPMAILEAWAAGTPTLMTEECNLDEGFAAGAALDSGYDVTAIANALNKALAMQDDEWAEMSRAAHDLATQRFDRDAIAARWAETYRALVAGQRAAA